MKVLYIGGTGDISYECLQRSVAAGHECTVFNRGREPEPLPSTVRRIVGDLTKDADFARLGNEYFDVVCQFKTFTLDDLRRDIRVFTGHCGQFIFISTASAYQKPLPAWRLTEDVPLGNPFWSYSRLKIEMEGMLLECHKRGDLPVTIVRPSLTYRRRFPGTFITGDDHAWRMLRGRPVIIHGDGQTLWTYTHARDFATLFVPLLGNPAALGQAYHVMTETAFTWESLFQGVAKALAVEPRFVHVPTQTLVRYHADWVGPLLGDKAWTTLFDTSKIQAISGGVADPVPLEVGFAGVLPYFQARMADYSPDPALHDLVDRIAREQESLGAS